MPHVIALGASTAGSATALLLARSGWDVTLVDPEVERATSPDEVVAPRAGSPQRVQAHAFMARTRHELRTRLPDVHRALLAAGADEAGVRDLLPPPLDDGGRPGDDDLAVYRVRRVVMDAVMARAVATEPNIRLVGDRPTGLLLGRDRPGASPRVTGVTLREGGVVDADVVVDAAGRRSPVAAWLGAEGLDGDETALPCGVRYYGRHYVVGPGERPPVRGTIASVSLYPTLDLLWFPSGGDHAVLAAAVHDTDGALKTLRYPEAFEAVVHEDPQLAPWLDLSEATTPVFAMGTVTSRLRRATRAGRPTVLGLHRVGDALCSTNPTRGRGVSLTLAAVGHLTDLLLEHHPDHEVVTRRMDEWVDRVLTPYFLEAARWDAERGRLKQAALQGRHLPANVPLVLLPEPGRVTSAQVERASQLDPDLARALVRAQWLMDDERRIASADVASLVECVLDGADPVEPPPPPPTTGLHDRSRILELVSPWLT